MGLAAPRKKAKISHDPNNTNWSRSTSGYGHRILSSQGWAPGDFLGARNAAHADLYTAASATHIKAAVKDDTLGLGAGSRRDPFNGPTGLGAFKGLLGRLNGKPEAQLEEEERNREDARLARYAATKWQTVRFISGGLLTQEKAESLRPKPSREDTGSNPELHNVPAAKRYKASDGNSESSTGHTQATTKPPKKRKSKKARTEQVDEEASKSERRKEKQTKKRKHNREDSSSTAPGERDTSQSESGNGPSKQKQLPTATVSKERRPMGRHILRGRHMDAKKKALLDDKSLSEIFMVKS